MTDLTEFRRLLQVEQTRFRAGVSENFAQTLGSSMNFILQREYQLHAWHLNGRYARLETLIGPDGVFPVLFPVTLVGYILYNGQTGISGTTVLDVHHLSGGDTDNGSIFTSKPSLDTTASNDTYSMYRITDSTTLALPTGHTLATFNAVDFAAGDALRLDIDNSMTQAQDVTFALMYRPRND